MIYLWRFCPLKIRLIGNILGGALQGKLQDLQEVLKKVKASVMHKYTSLWKNNEDLKDKHWRLEKTQDQLHSELQEKLEILTEENKMLDKKYVMAVDKYNKEKAKFEAREKSKVRYMKSLKLLCPSLPFLICESHLSFYTCHVVLLFYLTPQQCIYKIK